MSIDNIRERFSQNRRLFELYQQEIKKTIEKLEKQVNDLKIHVEQGGSIAIPSQSIKKPDGGYSTRIGLKDTPEMREVLTFAMNRKVDELKAYVEISLHMAFSHLMSLFDACFDDIVKVYLESVKRFFVNNQIWETTAREISRHSLKKQLSFFNKNAGIDFKSVLGDKMIFQVIERKECRNLIVHNEGFVDKFYVNNVKDTMLNIGEKYPLDYGYLDDSIDLLSLFIMHFSSEIELKLNTYIGNNR